MSSKERTLEKVNEITTETTAQIYQIIDRSIKEDVLIKLVEKRQELTNIENELITSIESAMQAQPKELTDFIAQAIKEVFSSLEEEIKTVITTLYD